MKRFRSSYVLAILFALFYSNANSITLHFDIKQSSPEIRYGVDQVKELQLANIVQFTANKPDFTIQLKIDSLTLKKEAYQLKIKNKTIVITGGNAVGVMYGLLELKNQLSSGVLPLQSKSESPNLAFRAIKYNLPWDSYRHSEALSLHYETCRDTNYWKAFLDMMAENRFNKLTLWNLHPFNYLVKTTKYPEACGFSDAEMVEWQRFWTTLFRMAKNRGIETYLMNWNIFVSPEFAKAHNVAQYVLNREFNVPQGDTSEIVKDYTRESIKAVINTYPDLAGLGITLGEGMGGMTPDERQQWILDSYIQGMRMANRKVKFIYRVPLSAGTGSGGSTSVEVEKMTRATLDTLTCVDGVINIELKFNWSHAFSTPHLVKVHGGVLSDTYWNPLSEKYKLAWMMRNEDFFMLRWGQPDFMRKHIENNVHPYVNGYFVGSECYIPAKDYITSLPGSSYRYAFDRQWMFYKVCGRLLYNPNTKDALFVEEFEKRFPTLGKTLFDAQTKASKVPLIIASYQNAGADFGLYTEGVLKITTRNEKKSVELITLAELATKIPMDPTYLSIADFLTSENSLPLDKISPFQLADSVDKVCKSALLEVSAIQTANNVDLLYEVSDIKAWAHLGGYFSNRLRAAVEYQRFKTTNDKKALEKSIAWLTKACGSWSLLVAVTKPIYKPVPLVQLMHNEKGADYFHWSIIEKQVVAELDWLKSLKN